jgi:hypothetical protein
MLVSMVAQSTSTSLAGGHGEGSEERGLRSWNPLRMFCVSFS